MSDARHELAEAASTAWHRYDLVVRFGGTSDERRFAFDLALKAEAKLAAHDLATWPKRVREATARALSGA